MKAAWHNTKPQTPNLRKALNTKRQYGAAVGTGGVAWLALVAALFLEAKPANGAQPHQAIVIAKSASQEGEANAESSAKQKQVTIEAIEPDAGRAEAKELAWLGVSAEEVPEALDAQLDLEPGAGLLVTYVAADSPAGKAGVQKNDVLAQFGDQLLVHPLQLRKLVRMHKAGDRIELTIFRAGKKQTISATLAKTSRRVTFFEDGNSLPGGFRDLHHQFSDIKIGDEVREQIKTLHESLARAGLDKQKLNLEINRSLDEARKAIHEALRHATNSQGVKDLEQLFHEGVGMGKDTTVVVKNDRKSVKTMVKTDDAGSYVIVASPSKRLTVHDAGGKLVFDGEIETPEQQKKVPREIWEKVQPMLEQMSSDKTAPPEEEDGQGDQGASRDELPGASEFDLCC